MSRWGIWTYNWRTRRPTFAWSCPNAHCWRVQRRTHCECQQRKRPCHNTRKDWRPSWTTLESTMIDAWSGRTTLDSFSHKSRIWCCNLMVDVVHPDVCWRLPWSRRTHWDTEDKWWSWPFSGSMSWCGHTAFLGLHKQHWHKDHIWAIRLYLD